MQLTMKSFKRSIAALLTWQFLVLVKKDSNFKKQIWKKQWRDKITYIAQKLFDFNMDFIADTKEKIEAFDQEAEINNAKAFIEKEYKSLQDTLESLTTKIESLKDKQVSELLDDVSERINLLMNKVETFQDQLDKKFWRKKKIKSLQSTYQEIISHKSDEKGEK